MCCCAPNDTLAILQRSSSGYNAEDGATKDVRFGPGLLRWISDHIDSLCAQLQQGAMASTKDASAVNAEAADWRRALPKLRLEEMCSEPELAKQVQQQLVTKVKDAIAAAKQMRQQQREQKELQKVSEAAKKRRSTQPRQRRHSASSVGTSR